MENLSEMPHFQIDFSDIAIVIPTLNRPEKAASRAEFWSKKGCQVIVAEGALHSEISLDPSILHVRSDNSFANRILEALSLTDAGLVALHPDDDFFSPRGLLFAAQELADTGISHGFCYGKTWEWVKSKNGDKLFPMYEASRTRRYSKKLYSLHFGSEGRFKFVPKVKYETCMLFGIYRRETLIKNCQVLRKHEPKCYGGFEILNSLLLLLEDSARYIPETLWLRDTSVPSVSADGDSWDRRIEFDEWYEREFDTWIVEFETTFLQLRGFQKDTADLDITLLRSGISSFFQTFLSSSSDQNVRQLRKWFDYSLRRLSSRNADSELSELPW
jgi:hypothetical protein